MIARVIVPTTRAVVLIALAAPVALLVAATVPGAWIAAPALGVTLLMLVLVDALAAGPLEEIKLIAPTDCEVGEARDIIALADLPGRLARRAEIAFEIDPRLVPGGRLAFPLRRNAASDTWQGGAAFTPVRRGTGVITRGWLRYRLPRQRACPVYRL